MGLIKSVSGVRGVVTSDDSSDITIHADVARRMGRAYASHLLRTRPSDGTSDDALVLVGGRDGRLTGADLLAAFSDGAIQSGACVVDVGIVTTPGVALMVQAIGAAGGVVITASHNPAQWNGIKLMTAEGQAPSKGDAERIFERFDRNEFVDRRIPDSLPSNVPDPHELHVSKVLDAVNVDRIRSRRFTVVLDSINGAGAVSGRALLERLGCRVVHLNARPAKVFAHTPEPTRANLAPVCGRVVTENVDVGFAQDPDADRVAMIDEAGRYIGEEWSVALAAMRVFQTHPGPAAANLSTSRLIDDIARAAGEKCRVHRSAVGEANVVETMRRHNCVIGGEGNGGVIDPRVVYVRDSLVGMALVLDLMAAEQQSLSAIVGRMQPYAMMKEKLPYAPSALSQTLAAVRREMSDGEVNDLDGIRIDWPDDQKWCHVRASNTEPIIRIIVEATSDSDATELMQRTQAVIRSANP